jgi:hypothetical protein
MTPREKAFELFDKMYNVDFQDDYELPSMQLIHAKRCALILVNEILDSSLYYFDEMDKYVIYWQQVKNEIEKL